jgi:hypothetical protein
MAGPAKKHAKAERQPEGSSHGSSSQSRDPTQRSVPKSIPRLDGNRDPSFGTVVDYTRPTDLKNISEFLGLGGWYQARGVSANSLLSLPASACKYPCTLPYKHSPRPMHVDMQTSPSPLVGQAAPWILGCISDNVPPSNFVFPTLPLDHFNLLHITSFFPFPTPTSRSS